MALDNEPKRWGMLQVANGPVLSHLVNPTGSNLDSETERLTLLNVYGGLTVSDTTAPVLSSPTGVATGTTTADGTVSTDEGNGTLYYYASQNSSELAATIKSSGQSQSVTGTGSQSVSVTGLSAETNYYLHYVQDDNAANESNVVSSAVFTTDSESEETASGGWWFSYEQEMLRRKEEEEERRRKAKETEKRKAELKSKLDRELVEALQEQQAEEARQEELKRLTSLVADNYATLNRQMGKRIMAAADRAIEQANYSAMEALERELARAREEEMFLVQATMLIVQ